MRTMGMAPVVSGRFYIGTVLKIMGEPGAFFESQSGQTAVGRPLAVLLVSALIYTGACALVYTTPWSWTVSGILLINAAGTPIIAAGVCCLAMRIIYGRCASFGRILGIYAYASAAFLLAAWMPYALIIAEPWRWWLIGKGLIRGSGLSRRAALLLIGITIVTLVLLYRILMQITAYS